MTAPDASPAAPATPPTNNPAIINAVPKGTVAGSIGDITTVPPDTAGAPESPAGLIASVLSAVAGGGVGFVVTGRVWAVHLATRPAPLAPQLLSTTGRELAPWASAAALVGIAGGLALLATRGRPRLLVAVLIALAGLGVATGGVRGLTDGAALRWPLLCLAAGTLILAAGGLALARSPHWPAMGSRYDAPSTNPAPRPSPDATPAALWDALDAGNDPTTEP